MPEVAQAVCRLLLDQPYYKQAKSVACYLSMGHGELRTNGIVDDILASGKSRSSISQKHDRLTLYRQDLVYPISTPSASSSDDRNGRLQDARRRPPESRDEDVTSILPRRPTALSVGQMGYSRPWDISARSGQGVGGT